MTDKDTKQKIIDASNELFAEQGYGGTSVRDIASKADVNLAAINYHFKNKENLYWQVFDYNYSRMKDEITKFAEECENMEELACKTFVFFANSPHAMMNTFKLFLANMNPPEQPLKMDEQEKFGPPGHMVFAKQIEKDLGMSVPEEAKLWAVKMIFSLIFHLGMVVNSPVVRLKCKTDPTMRPEEMEKMIRHTVKSHLEYLKTKPKFDFSLK